MIDYSAVSTRQPETGVKISKFSGHFFSPQKSPQNSRPRVPFNDYGVVRAFQVIVNTFQ